MFWQKWPLQKIVFEDTKRQRGIEPGLVAEMRRLRLPLSIDWVKFAGGQIQSDEDLASKVISLEPLLRGNQLYMHSELPHLTSLYLQFSRFPKFKIRSIPAAVSRLMHYRRQTNNSMAMALYGSELYSPSITWDPVDPELGAGLIG
jgi:hypothetical protein